MTMEEFGSLLIRITLGYLFLLGGWSDAIRSKVRHFNEAEASLVFHYRPDLFALIGLVIMLGGGLSVLLGIFPRLGALGMAIFLVPATMIHFVRRDMAVALKDDLLASAKTLPEVPVRRTIEELGDSAFMGHFAAGVKTIALLGPALYLVFVGGRMPMLIGFDTDWRLIGFLT